MATAIVFAVYIPPHAPAPGTGMLDDVDALLVGDDAGDVLAVGLEGRDDVARLSERVAGADRAAVHHQRRPVEPRHRDDRAGHVLVAARDGDERVVPLRPITVSIESAIRSRDGSE